MGELHKQIQALLFSEGGALTYRSLARSLGADEAAVRDALEKLARQLEGTGLGLVRSDTGASLTIAPDAREAVTKVLEEEGERAIGEAGLEILAILLYEGPATRAQIDYIRGVNSSSTLRTLLTRGLVERSGNPEDGREYVYRATVDLLAYLGVTAREELPEYGTIAPELAAFKNGQEAGHNDHGAESGRTETGEAD